MFQVVVGASQDRGTLQVAPLGQPDMKKFAGKEMFVDKRSSLFFRTINVEGKNVL
jgi:hypothetical protein